MKKLALLGFVILSLVLTSAIRACPPGYHVCADGSEIPDSQKCPEDTKTCPDGTVVGKDEECPPPPTCPAGQVMGDNGECQPPPSEGCKDGQVVINGVCTTPETKVTVTHVNPTTSWCPVGNGFNALKDAKGKFPGGYWSAKDYGKGWLAIEVSFLDSDVNGKSFTLTSGNNSMVVTVKDIGNAPDGRCDVTDVVIKDPVAVATSAGLRFDESVGGPGSGPEVGSVTVGEKSWTMMQFDANQTVNQQLGYAAYVPLTNGFAVGIHNVEIGSFAKGDIVVVNGVTYKVSKVKTMSKDSTGRIKTGFYLITCKGDQNLVGFLTKE